MRDNTSRNRTNEDRRLGLRTPDTLDPAAVLQPLPISTHLSGATH